MYYEGISGKKYLLKVHVKTVVVNLKKKKKKVNATALQSRPDAHWSAGVVRISPNVIEFYGSLETTLSFLPNC